MMLPFLTRILVFTFIVVLGSASHGQHRLAIHGNGVLAILGSDGDVEWDMNWPDIHDIHVLPNGNIMVQLGWGKVAEIDHKTKHVVWCYDSASMNGNLGQKVEVHSFQPLDDGSVMIAESGRQRIIEVDRTGKILKTVKLKVSNPHPHTDTRLVRKIRSGNYLVCHEGDGFVREYSGENGEVVWEYEVPLFDREPTSGHGVSAWGNKLFSAVRLENGNTLLTTGNGHSVVEVTPEKEVVWHLKQNDLTGIQLAWVTTVEVLSNGNYVIGNCHAGPDNPLLIEIEPKSKRVIWTLDQFDQWGNSVPNTQLLSVEGTVRR